MTRFLYKAKNNKGEIVTGTVKAQNEAEAEKALFEHNLVASEIIPERQIPVLSFLKGRISVKEKAMFTRQLSTMLSAGLSLTKAITILAKQTQNERLREIFLDIYRDLQEGFTFSSALSKHPEAFDRVYISVVNSGESTGKLDVVLNELAGQLENDSSFISKVKSALYYPAFIFVAMIVAGGVMMVYVIPKLTEVFEQSGKELPIVTRIIIAISGFLQSWWWIILLLIIGGSIAFRYWSMTDSGSRTINQVQLRIPFLKKVYEGLYMYRFTRVMSMLIGAGVPLLDALRIGASVIDNVIYEESLMVVANQVERGVAFSNPLLKDPLFPPIIGHMVSVGEETGELDKVLGKVASYYEESTNDITKAISSIIEPFVLIMVGLAVAVLVFAIYLPIYQVNQVS
ncbi:MAG TPA: type II secretion system F family protein [bacterium]|nr:type II secretion system F family protein [bacterium]